MEQQRREELARQKLQLQHEEMASIGSLDQQMPQPKLVREPVVREGRKIGRNDPCPCGSGKKYKSCHGQLE